MRAFVAAGIGLIALATGRQFRDWGATKRECLTRLPGDDLVAEPADITTRAVGAGGATPRSAVEYRSGRPMGTSSGRRPSPAPAGTRTVV
jgi:hypothetical protein